MLLELKNIRDTAGYLKVEPAELKYAFLKASAIFNFPTLKGPVFKKSMGGAEFNFKTNIPVFDPDYIKELSAKSSLSAPDIVLALAVHEIGHYMIFPAHLHKLIYLNKLISAEITPEDHRILATLAIQTFSDLINNTKCILKENVDKIVIDTLKTAVQNSKALPVFKTYGLILYYLKFQAGYKYQKVPEFESYLEMMSIIDFSKACYDYKEMKFGVKIWIDILRNILKETMIPGFDKFEFGLVPKDCDIDFLKKASNEEIRSALRKLITELSMEEYNEVIDSLGEFNKVNNVQTNINVKSLDNSTNNGEMSVKVNNKLLDYYKFLSAKFPVKIESKKGIQKAQKIKLDLTEKFKCGSDPNLVLPGSSGGRILLGLTRKAGKKVLYDTKQLLYPDLLLVIDSSGSMPNPNEIKSLYVLAAFSIVQTYLRLSPKNSIGVINFSNKNFYLPFTRDIHKILSSIIYYQGHGTTVDLSLLTDLLEIEIKTSLSLHLRHNGKKINNNHSRKRNIDLILLSDLEISNVDETIDLLEKRKLINRATTITLERSRKYQRTKLISLNTIEDIKKIKITGTYSL